MNGGVLEGYSETSNLLVFTVTVDAHDATLSLPQHRAVVHPDPFNTDELLTIDPSAITLTFQETATDGDGDSLSETFTRCRTDGG